MLYTKKNQNSVCSQTFFCLKSLILPSPHDHMYVSSEMLIVNTVNTVVYANRAREKCDRDCVKREVHLFQLHTFFPS